MFGVVIGIHVTACILLIITVLVQSGRSSGLVESFSFAESIFGTKTPKLMTRLTTTLATLFIISCVVLSILTYQRSRSLMEKEVIKSPKKAAVESVKSEAPLVEEVQKQIPQEEKAEDVLPSE